MAKQISITVPNEMYEKIQLLKEEMSGPDGKRKISKICQTSISLALVEAEASRAYRLAGIKDGKNSSLKFSKEDKNYISRVLSKSGPYKKWSRFEKIEEVKRYFEEIKKIDIDDLYPRFTDIMDGNLTPLHDWLKIEDEQIIQDRRGEVAWSYTEGFYQGIIMDFD